MRGIEPPQDHCLICDHVVRSSHWPSRTATARVRELVEGERFEFAVGWSNSPPSDGLHMCSSEHGRRIR